MPTIGEKIREIRIQRSLTQTDLGGELVTASMISQIEADRAKPSYQLLTYISNRLGMPVEYFMSEMDDQFSFSAILQMANYYVLIEQPEEALRLLHSLSEPIMFGLNYQEYMLVKVRAVRQLRRYEEACQLIDVLREKGYQSQDQSLLFQVAREAGYLEYGLQNWEGAIHEWRKAVQLGEELADEVNVSRAYIASHLTTLLILLDELDKEPHPNEAPYLEQAAHWMRSSANFKEIGKSFIEDCKKVLSTDAAKAKVLAERAVSLLDAARLVEEHILVHVKLASEEGGNSLDPWAQAALATASSSPLTFVESELKRIERLMQSGDLGVVEERLSYCYNMFGIYLETADTPSIRSYEIQATLAMSKAQVLVRTGQMDAAIEHLEAESEMFLPYVPRGVRLRTWAYLVLWHGQLEHNTEALEYTQLMEELLLQESRIPQS